VQRNLLLTSSAAGADGEMFWWWYPYVSVGTTWYAGAEGMNIRGVRGAVSCHSSAGRQ